MIGRTNVVDPAKCLHFLWFPCYRHIASLLIKIYADDLSRPLIHPVYPVVRQIHDSKVRNVTFLPRLEWNWVDPSDLARVSLRYGDLAERYVRWASSVRLNNDPLAHNSRR